MQSIEDKLAFTANGFVMLLLMILVMVLLVTSGIIHSIIGSVICVLLAVSLTGFSVLGPNESRVVTFFGQYIGTIHNNGFIWTVPFSNRRKIPLKLVNFITDKLKVNDQRGNPIEIGAVIIWRVEDSAKAAFNVDDYRAFVANQADVALRAIAATHPYDSEDGLSLRGHIDEIGHLLAVKLQEKLAMVGITITEARIAHLAYAPEIAMAMLRRQQAEAILQARKYLVENALTIVDSVLDHFSKEGLLSVSDDKKISLINNLLVSITSEKETHPVINIG
ncbi:MAG: SPFH domain-containing protein [Alphaproteobacteria bacterium]